MSQKYRQVEAQARDAWNKRYAAAEAQARQQRPRRPVWYATASGSGMARIGVVAGGLSADIADD